MSITPNPTTHSHTTETRGLLIASLRRMAATVVLLGTVIGVPALLVLLVHVPLPSWALLRDAWERQHITSDVVVAFGVGVFTLLWLWFGVTALSEMVAVRRWRRSESAVPPPVAPGPGRWVRVLVRIAMVSTLAGSLSAVAMGGAVTNAAAVAVTAGDVATSHSTVSDLVGPVGPEVAATADDSLASTLQPFLAGLGSALTLSAGALVAIDRHRRRSWRASTAGARLARPSLQQVRTEMLLRSVAPAERAARLDLAIRAAAPRIAAVGAVVLAATVDDAGAIVLHTSETAHRDRLEPPWTVRASELGSEWSLSASVGLTELVSLAADTSPPCPAMLHVGRTNERAPGVEALDVYVDIEAIGVLSVISPSSSDIVRALAASLALSPFLDGSTLLVAGVDDLLDPRVHSARCESAASLDVALDRAISRLGSTRSLAPTGTFGVRAGSTDEALPPVLVASAGTALTAQSVADLRMLGAGAGLGVVVDVDATTASPWCIRADAGTDGSDSTGGRHVLEPLDLAIIPLSLRPAAVAAVADLIVAASEPAIASVPAMASEAVVAHHPLVEPEWSLMVRVLGPVEVVTADGEPVVFDRAKALELVAWLSQHRERPTRSAARTALWDTVVRDATFANVVSDARRAMARAIEPPPDDEWIARTLTDQLPLHVGVISDADLLALRVEAARHLPRGEAIEVLRPGVDLLGGLPFAGSSYLWTDAEGITSSLVLLATGAAIDLARHLLDADDIDGVFWATGQGLKVLAGHEELIALRMRAHARRGDLAGVRHEWASYERALAADTWAAADPSPKLVALRAELLASRSPVDSVSQPRSVHV